MLELDVNQSRSLNFEIQLTGIDPKQLKGFLRIVVDGVEYGFKANISSENITVDIPTLKSFILREIREGEKFEVKLRVHGAGHYLKPWEDFFVVKNSVVMKAKIREDLDSKVPEIVAKVKSELSNKAKSKLVEMKKVSKPKINVIITEKHILNYMESKGTTSEQVQKLILEQCKRKARTDDPKDILRSVVHFYKNKDR